MIEIFVWFIKIVSKQTIFWFYETILYWDKKYSFSIAESLRKRCQHNRWFLFQVYFTLEWGKNNIVFIVKRKLFILLLLGENLNDFSRVKISFSSLGNRMIIYSCVKRSVWLCGKIVSKIFCYLISVVLPSRNNCSIAGNVDVGFN